MAVLADRETSATFCGLDPRSLLLAAIGAAFAFSFVQQLSVAFACLGLGVCLVFMNRLSWSFMLRRLVVANLFIVFLWLTVPFSVSGNSLVNLGPLSISQEGIALASLVTVKCNAILLVFIAFTSNLSLPVVGSALEGMRTPARLVFLFLFTCRYIYVIGAEWQKLQTAASLRGFVALTNWHTYATIANMLGLTIVNSIDRSRRVYEAMLLRGFSGNFLTMADLSARPRDGVFIFLFFFTLASLLILDNLI